MGVWSTAFYGDDLTCDVRDNYKHFLRMKYTPEQAIEKLVKDFQPEEAEDGYLFWLALADTQWRLGHLTQPLKERCLVILDSDLDAERWEEASAGDQRKRKAILEQLKIRLTSPQCAPKKVAPYRGEKPLWKIGDYVSIRFGKIDAAMKVSPYLYGPEWLDFQGKYGVLRVVGIDYHENTYEQVTDEYAVVAVLDWIGSRPATVQELEQPLRLVPGTFYHRTFYFYSTRRPVKWEKDCYELKVIHHSDCLPDEWGDPLYPMDKITTPLGTLYELVVGSWIKAGRKAPD